MKHEIELNWKGEMLFESEQPDGNNIMLDSDPQFGGQGKGTRPKPLMLTALAGCTGMDVASLMKKMRLEVDDFKVDVQADLTEEHPKHYENVVVKYHFYGKNLNHEKLKKCVNLSEERYCGVIYMFQQFTTVTSEIIFHDNQ